MRFLQPKYKLIFLVGAFLIMSFDVIYQEDKTITEQFQLQGVGQLTIHNLHGDINVKKWDQKDIKIEVVVSVSSRNSDAAGKFIDETTVNFSQDEDHVYAITQLAKVNLKKKWWQWGFDTYSFAVNYNVFIPEIVNLEIENQHGDVHIESYDGDLDIDIAHGELTTDFITGKADLKIEYGEVVMKGLTNGKIDILYSEFETLRAGNLYINSTRTEVDIDEALDITAFTKYDEYKVGSMGNFINEGAYDEINIGTVRHLDISSRFSEINVDVCEVGMDMELYDGEVTIDYVSPAFDGGMIQFEYTEVEISIDYDFILDLKSEHTDLELDDLKGPDYEESDRIQNKFYKGRSSNGKVLKIIAKHGSLEIND